MAASIPTVIIGDFAGGPDRLITYSQNVATGQNPLTATPLVLFTMADSGFHNRIFSVAWTGDQTLTLELLFDLGSAGNGLVTVVKILFVAGNVTTQQAAFYAGVGATAASGTILTTGTQPTWATPPTVGSWEFLKAPADRLSFKATGGGTTTVGTLTIDVNEAS